MTRKVLKREVVELILGDSLPYELNMLEQMFIRLHVHEPDQWVANALIESFCIHARTLCLFFANKDHVKAKQFTGGSYGAQYPISKLLVDKLHDQIAHLSANRPDVEEDKIGPQERATLVTRLILEARNFASKLSPSDRALMSEKFSSMVLIAPID